jgi:hypothetical protein
VSSTSRPETDDGDAALLTEFGRHFTTSVRRPSSSWAKRAPVFPTTAAVARRELAY